MRKKTWVSQADGPLTEEGAVLQTGGGQTQRNQCHGRGHGVGLWLRGGGGRAHAFVGDAEEGGAEVALTGHDVGDGAEEVGEGAVGDTAPAEGGEGGEGARRHPQRAANNTRCRMGGFFA